MCTHLLYTVCTLFEAQSLSYSVCAVCSNHQNLSLLKTMLLCYWNRWANFFGLVFERLLEISDRRIWVRQFSWSNQWNFLTREKKPIYFRYFFWEYPWWATAIHSWSTLYFWTFFFCCVHLMYVRNVWCPKSFRVRVDSFRRSPCCDQMFHFLLFCVRVRLVLPAWKHNVNEKRRRNVCKKQ